MTGRPENISLSVIVPCYNVAPYLESSLKCLERQWGARIDYEIILVNDASRDDTIKKLNDFRSQYPDNVTVIDKQQNEGVAAARNSGLDIARGEWIAFFDPDDLLADRGYERLLSLAENGGFDILRFGVEAIWEGNELPSSDPLSPLFVDWQGTSVEYLLENSFGTCWSYLFKRELLSEQRFPLLTICEDTLFNLTILLKNKLMARTLTSIYYYIGRHSSTTNMIDYVRLSRQCDDIFQAINLIEGLKDGQPEEVRQRLQRHQFVFSPNLLTRMLLSDKKLKSIKEIVAALKKLSLFPLPGNLPGADFMMQVLNVVFSHSFLIPLFRPIYRYHRSR